MPLIEIVQRAVAKAGGVQQFAAKVGLRNHETIYSWQKHIPAQWVRQVHEVTGIPLEELRPDLYPPQEKPTPW